MHPSTPMEANKVFIDCLYRMGIRVLSGVNGGGIIHLTKFLPPLNTLNESELATAHYFTVPEYTAGFIPLGSYLASKKIGATLTTTGIANELSLCAASDAHLHNLPMVSLLALCARPAIGLSPLQDNSSYGTNILDQAKAKFKERLFIIDDAKKIEKILLSARNFLKQSRPIAIAFYPDALSEEIQPFALPEIIGNSDPTYSKEDLNFFINSFPKQVDGKRVVLYIGQEASLEGREKIASILSNLSQKLQGPTVWSLNGANAIDPNNPYLYGYLGMGGSDPASELWNSLTNDDTVLVIGCDFNEYDLNLLPINANVWHFTSLIHPYGEKEGTFSHRVRGSYHKVRGSLIDTLSEVLRSVSFEKIKRPVIKIPELVNKRSIERVVSKGAVDLVDFYEIFHRYLVPNTIIFDDVCLSYKDRQYLLKKPLEHVRFYSLHQSSSMGGALGLGIGAKLSDPSLNVFISSGDGCFRLYAGALASAAKLGLRLFILNNQDFGIVSQGLKIIFPNLKPEFYHSRLSPIDFVKAAEAFGWAGYKLKEDLSNLEQIMQACNERTSQSILIDIPCDPAQEIGLNPRLQNLIKNVYL